MSRVAGSREAPGDIISLEDRVTRQTERRDLLRVREIKFLDSSDEGDIVLVSGFLDVLWVDFD